MRPTPASVIVLIVGLALTALRPVTASAQSQAALFDDSTLQEIRLVMNSGDWNTLKQRYEENTYYPVDLKWNGITVRNAGIRSRGNITRSGLKPGLHLDFNRYISDQVFVGLKALNLKNMYGDGSLIRESVTMKLYGRLGIPVPRESHARVSVNNEYIGVYVIVEEIDRDFIARLWGAAEANVEMGGYLYKYRWVYPYRLEDLGPALDQYAQILTPKTHETASMSALFGPIRDMIAAVNGAPDDRFDTTAGAWIDLPALVKFTAAEEFVAAVDGLVGAWGVNNVYLYRPPYGRPSLWLPWDRDDTFEWPDLPIDFDVDANVLTHRALQVPALRKLFLDTLRRCAEIAAEPTPDDPRGWLEREAYRQAAQIAPAVDEDPAKPVSFDEFATQVQAIERFARSRPALVGCYVDASEAGLPPAETCAPRQ